MQKNYITSREMQSLEVNAQYFGISLLQLMENAGRNVATEINARFEKNQRIMIFCGLGGNGGDGFVAARHLLSLGFEQVVVVLVGKIRDVKHVESLANLTALQQFRENIQILEVFNISDLPKARIDVLVDALLGTGTKGVIKEPIAQFVDYINSAQAFKLAVDIPTGIDSDTGEILGKAVKADITVSFHKAKKGLAAAKKHAGKIIVSDIGLPREFESHAGPGDVMLVTKKRAPWSHKGDFGKVLFVGGSEVFSGAPALMSMAALRTGVDIAYTAAPEKSAHDIASMSPNLITVKLQGEHLEPENVDELQEYIDSVDAIAAGPGAGRHPETVEFFRYLVEAAEEANKPLLLDADGLKAFARFKRILKIPLVLTPHAEEYSALTGEKLPEDLTKRVEEIKQKAAEFGAVILLKGKVDIVSDGKRAKLNFTGNPGMTVGGTGDVLSGVVGGLLAQKTDPFEAATAGAFVNGAAGDIAVSNVGYHLLATDLLDFIPQVLSDPLSHLKVQNLSGKGN